MSEYGGGLNGSRKLRDVDHRRIDMYHRAGAVLPGKLNCFPLGPLKGRLPLFHFS